jgi:hypothetical protein
VTTLKWARVFEGKFFFRWMTEPFGVGLDHALGDDYLDFLRQPMIVGTPTWLVAFLHLAALAIAVVIAWRWVCDWRNARPRRAAIFPTGSPTALVCHAGLWGYGILLTLTCLPMHRQYMIIVYSIELLWVAHAALRTDGNHRGNSLKTGRQLLSSLIVVQLLISASFLHYVHVKQVIRGDYGVALRYQQSLNR